jgi:hypothetical protein
VTRKSPSLRIALTAALVLVFALVPAALAGNGKPGGGGRASGTIKLHLLNGDTVPRFGHQVTFDVTASWSQPYVNLNCYQNGAWVSGEWGGFYAGSAYDQIFTLGPSNSWTSGDADCKADLVEWTPKGTLAVRASVSFHVYG